MAKKDNSNISEENAKTAARLRALRAEKGSTQKQMSEVLGVSQQTYSAYEKNGSMDSDAIIKLCKKFDVSADYLLGIDGEKKEAGAFTQLLSDLDPEELLKLALASIQNNTTKK